MQELLLPADALARVETLSDVLARDSRIVFAYLFGSAARHQLNRLSDIDLAVFLDDPAQAAAAQLDILDAVGQHLRTDRIDLVILNGAPVALAGRIVLERRVLLDRRPTVRHRFESLTLRMFHDFHYVERAILEQRYGHG